MSARRHIAHYYCRLPVESLALATVLSYSLVREKSRNGDPATHDRSRAEFLFALGRYIYGDNDWQRALREHSYSPTQDTAHGLGESYDRAAE